jgi:hypothetical protein
MACRFHSLFGDAATAWGTCDTHSGCDLLPPFIDQEMMTLPGLGTRRALSGT